MITGESEIMANQVAATIRALDQITEHAQSRKRDVANGLETAQIAGLLTRKYGYGLCDALGEIYRESHRGPTYLPTYSDVDKIAASIDPAWEATRDVR
jgi:hypothetical protein